MINAQVLACETPQQLKYSCISKAQSADWQRYLIKSYWVNYCDKSSSALLTASREKLLRKGLCSLRQGSAWCFSVFGTWQFRHPMRVLESPWAIYTIWPVRSFFSRPTFLPQPCYFYQTQLFRFKTGSSSRFCLSMLVMWWCFHINQSKPFMLNARGWANLCAPANSKIETLLKRNDHSPCRRNEVRAAQRFASPCREDPKHARSWKNARIHTACWSVHPLICAWQTVIEREGGQGVVLQPCLCQAARPPGRMLPMCNLNCLSDIFLLKQQDDFISFSKVI